MKSFYAGRHIWILGAGSGIGRALAIELAKRGAVLCLSGRRKAALNAVLSNLLGKGHRIWPVDVSDRRALGKATASFKRLDGVIFLAALYAPHSKRAKELDFIHQSIAVNLGGAFNLVDAVVPILGKGGQIALCGSVAGYRGLPYGQPYCATKAALINYAESLKIEYSDLDIKIINPGFVRTPLTDKNDFPMPMIIEPDQAASAIADGLMRSSFEIHFPKKFTFLMKFLHLLPYFLYFRLVSLLADRMP